MLILFLVDVNLVVGEKNLVGSESVGDNAKAVAADLKLVHRFTGDLKLVV